MGVTDWPLRAERCLPDVSRTPCLFTTGAKAASVLFEGSYAWCREWKGRFGELLGSYIE